MVGLTFAIYPALGSVSLWLFQRTIEDVHRLISNIHYAVTKERGARRWIIQELRSSTPTITVKPSLENEELEEAIINGLVVVSSGAIEPPTYFTEEALVDLIRMRRLFVGRDPANRLEFRRNGRIAVVGKDIASKAERILKGGYWALGSIEGTLEVINLHRNPSFTIWDRVSKAPVRCYFPKTHEWTKKVKELLEKRVMVRGKISYFRNGIPRSVTDIEEAIDETPSVDLPKTTFGSIPTKEAAEDVANFLRKIRAGGRI